MERSARKTSAAAGNAVREAVDGGAAGGLQSRRHPRMTKMLRPPRLGPSAAELSERQRALLDELEVLIVDQGFASLTVGSIASKLRCSRSTLYELAPSKDELVLVVVDRRLRRIGHLKQERIDEIVEPAEKIRLVLSGEYLGLPRTGQRFMEDIARSPAVQRLIAHHFRYGVAVLRDVVEDGIASGHFRNLHSLIVAEAIDAILDRMQHPDILQDTGLTFEEATAEMTELLLNGLTTRRS